uniref:mitochondrial fission factor homolog A-like isoform X1 n=1 Tax=Myxine glutinosa TaxID=7769 RepID=UPI00358E31FE
MCSPSHPCLPNISSHQTTEAYSHRHSMLFLYHHAFYRSLDLSANESQLMDAMHGKEVDLLTLHRQVLRLNQRLRATEHAQEKSARREVLLCSAMTILLLINGWFWLRR